MKPVVTAFGLAVVIALGLCVASDPPPLPAAPATQAERVARLTRLIADAERERDELQQQIDSPNSEFGKAEADFTEIDRDLAAKKKRTAQLKADGKTDELKAAQEEVAKLQKWWDSRKERFNLAIGLRQTTLDKLVLLRAQIEKDKKLLAAIEGKSDPAQPTPAVAVTTSTAKPNAPPPAATVPVVVAGVPAVAVSTPPPASPTDAPVQPVDPEVRAARQKADAKYAELRKARDAHDALQDRVKLLDDNLRVEAKMLDTERQTADRTWELLDRLNDALANRTPTDPEQLSRLTDRIRDTEERLQASRNRVEEMTERVGLLTEELVAAREDVTEATRLADAAQAEADAAEADLAGLTDPLRPRNLARRAAEHAPAVAGILAGMFALHLLAGRFAKQIVRLVARNSHRGTEEDKENRARTLVAVFRYAAGLFVFGGGVVMVLDELGVPVVPLMGGAAVVGLAVAFGAQNLIRDYFTGFMILMEDQYGINDVVKIGDTAGVVENITLRVTALRDMEGVLHFIPHGAIKDVSNLTHGWSRALFDIEVPAAADLDRAIDALVGLGRELRADPAFGPKMVESPEMLGVKSLTLSTATVRFLIKTKPLQQWAVKREMLRRIKRRFDELGITGAKPAPAPEAVTVRQDAASAPSFHVAANGSRG